MHVDYINQTINSQAFQFAIKKLPACQFLYQVSTRQKSYQLILNTLNLVTGRRKVIMVTDKTNLIEIMDDQLVIHVQDGDIENLCQTIATSSERIAAIIIDNYRVSAFTQKKVRELASAEGAILILDEANHSIDAESIYIQSSSPDILLFFWQEKFWVGSKFSLLNQHENVYLLPNGKQIFHLNNYETDFVYDEIYRQQIYQTHELDLANNPVIFDIGANIGLFTLFVKENYPNSVVYAFEPCPNVYPLLCRNTDAYRKSVNVYPYAISSEIQSALFHYYEDFSVISGFHVDQQKDAAVIFQGMCATNETAPKIKPVIKKRLSRLHSYQCQTSTISAVIKMHQIEKIDLLKMDIEGSELMALYGIQSHDWRKIKHIRMEVHNLNLLSEITALLTEKNFHVSVKPDEKLGVAGISNLSAVQCDVYVNTID